MSIFNSNPEFQFTCNRCHNVWYMTKKEIAESHKAAQTASQLRLKRTGAIRIKTINGLTQQISVLEHTANSDKKCPCCGSHSITKVKA